MKSVTAPLPILLLVLAACASTGPDPAPATPWRAVARAREAVRIGDRDGAFDILREALARYPRDSGVRREFGLLLAEAGDDGATQVLAPLASAPEPDPVIVRSLARLAIRARDPDAAAAHLARLARTPELIGAEAYEIQADLALLRGDAHAAVRPLRQALILDSDRPETWRRLLRIAETTGDDALRREARAALERACPGRPALGR